jgi:protocatechuate 3,4-dioxygenase beta subunit
LIYFQLISLGSSLIKARKLDTLIDARDAPASLNTSHLSNVTHTPHDALSTIFAGNKSCILVPEVTEGPYYVSGEFIRSDVSEKSLQTGIDLLLDIQVIEVTTCEPVPNVMIYLWHANATGVYSGVVTPGNGNSDVQSNINTTFGRGLQPTNKDDVAQFTTFYPGHYFGRTQHFHVATHVNGT